MNEQVTRAGLSENGDDVIGFAVGAGIPLVIALAAFAIGWWTQ